MNAHTPTPNPHARQCAFIKPNGERCRCAKWNYSRAFCKAHAATPQGLEAARAALAKE